MNNNIYKWVNGLFGNTNEAQWDIVLPDLPKERPNVFAQLFGLSSYDNWANDVYGLDALADQILPLMKKKISIFILDTAPAFTNNYLNTHKQINNSLRFNATGVGSNLLDVNGHGTHVAGCIGAIHPTYRFGVLQKYIEEGWVEIIPVKVLDGITGSYDWLRIGLDYVVNCDVGDRVKIVNMSLGGRTYDPAIHNSIKKGFEQGIIYVAAAGNEGKTNGDNINYPARLEEVIATGALAKDLSSSKFSNMGAEMHSSAPGELIYSSYLKNGYIGMSGTSMASPINAAVISLVRSMYPDLSSAEFLEYIKDKFLDIDSTGWDKNTGYGILSMQLVLDNPYKEKDPDQDTDIHTYTFHIKSKLPIGFNYMTPGSNIKYVEFTYKFSIKDSSLFPDILALEIDKIMKNIFTKITLNVDKIGYSRLALSLMDFINGKVAEQLSYLGVNLEFKVEQLSFHLNNDIELIFNMDELYTTSTLMYTITNKTI